MFETTFKNLDDTLRKDAGCATEMDYIEQTSWVLFLKYLDDFEADREATAKFSGNTQYFHIMFRGVHGNTN